VLGIAKCCGDTVDVLWSVEYGFWVVNWFPKNAESNTDRYFEEYPSLREFKKET
jgi:hypothetical protein